MICVIFRRQEENFILAYIYTRVYYEKYDKDMYTTENKIKIYLQLGLVDTGYYIYMYVL